MALSRSLKVGSAFAIVTGSMDALFGLTMLEGLSGDSLPISSTVSVVADSQFRYLGSMWACYGAMLWWAADDLQARRVPLAILGGAMFFGGIGRAISAASHGFGTRLIGGFTAFELLAPPAIWLLGA